MFDIGWSEMAVIMMLALIIIGPRDLPRVARTIGQWVRKGRALAREFQTSLEEMARETELDQVKKEIEKVGRTDFKKSLENTIDPKGELTSAFDVASGSSAKPALTESTDSAARNKTLPAATTAHGNGASPPARSDSAAASSDGAAKPAVKPVAAKAKTKTSSAKTSSAKTTGTAAATKKSRARPAVGAKAGSTGKKPAKTTAGNKTDRGDRVAMTAKPS